MRAYAYQNNPSEVMHSSSGGAYRRIIQSISLLYPNEKFVYYGAAWNDDLSVSHKRVTNIDDAARLFSGSKYVRSNISGIAEQVGIDLTEGKFVIFSGTPCQVYGILSYARGKNIPSSKLFTIDIICHGTPKKEIMSDTLKWWSDKEGSPVIEMSCRDKRVGWKGYPISLKFQDGKEWMNNYYTQTYIRLFFTHLVMYRGCYSCQFSNLERHSDITIGDFWGVEDVFPKLAIGKGVSLILANTGNGQFVIDNIHDTLNGNEILSECKDDSYRKYQHNLNMPTEMPKEYDQFWKDYSEKGFEYILRHYNVNNFRTYASYCKYKLSRRIKGNRSS
jgi:coenzyme F420-reducing hydrogenase beta subunit